MILYEKLSKQMFYYHDKETLLNEIMNLFMMRIYMMCS